MNLKHHKTLTLDKWLSFSFDKQILMIANELNRASNWIGKHNIPEAKLCYERAFELLYLTIALLKEKNKLREFLRFKEMLARLYAQELPAQQETLALLRILISLDKKSFALLPFSAPLSSHHPS